jgi:hypothetical protein
VAQVTGAITASSADIYPNMPSYYRRLRLLGSGRIDACAALGGAGAPSGGLAALLVGQPALALGLGAAGILLLIAALAWAARASVETPRRGVWADTPRRGVWADTPRRGVAASGPHIGDTLVSEASAWGHLLVLEGEDVVAEHALSTPSVVIGRSQGATVMIAGDPAISREHARLTFLGGRAQIDDLGSSHGTQVNGRKIAGPTTLRPGDLITLGQTIVRYEA